MTCDCQDWKENIDKVDAPLLLQYARNPTTTQGYDGKQFVYCPWCSKGLSHEIGSDEDMIANGFHESSPEEIAAFSKFAEPFTSTSVSEGTLTIQLQTSGQK